MFFSLYILRHVSAASLGKELIAVRRAWFGLKASSEVAEIFDIRSGVDTAIDLGLCIDAVSDLGYFIFPPTSVCLVPMLSLTFLCHTSFGFSRYIS